MKILIALAGEKGSGKDTFAEIFMNLVKDHTVSRCRSSEILSDTLAMWNLPKTRRNLQYVAIWDG
jgi:uridine kinase